MPFLLVKLALTLTELKKKKPTPLTHGILICSMRMSNYI